MSTPAQGLALTEPIHDPDYGIVVIRYVPTYIEKSGLRTLMFGAQGRNTFATPEEAQAAMDAVINNPHNSPETLRQLWGDNPRFEVRPCKCWPVHFDPCGIYFDA
jgi:hypothetical protein